jgi:HPt (histidine-containing phosphotransfer) domain-containing protein
MEPGDGHAGRITPRQTPASRFNEEASTMAQTAKATELLYSSLGGDPDLADLVELFVEEMPDRAAALSERFDASDWEGLRRTAHQLKGAAGSYGYAPISQYAAVLEEAVKQDEPEAQIRDAVEGLIAICGRACGGTPDGA